MDAAPQNGPTYPNIRRTDEEQKCYHWERPTQQPITTEILHSDERPNVTAVFGTPLAPKGLSGKIRRYAFQYSENSYGHWLLPLLADRVDEIERNNCYNIF
ncbi:hypothetical protein [Persicitalea jodogahamensis]|uniref:Uncharacterized protein n=1 Tax=Persicitalea jodogahamensis TaxID=402147 RepID=A0A8J3G9H0_9BACT|nr:hypothetical protein [Persicitalea jodogahamensis]GHB75129.1 hypothetical protein GCM10007390_31090 [Persicitalea jodogahamensis]